MPQLNKSKKATANIKRSVDKRQRIERDRRVESRRLSSKNSLLFSVPPFPMRKKKMMSKYLIKPH